MGVTSYKRKLTQFALCKLLINRDRCVSIDSITIELVQIAYLYEYLRRINVIVTIVLFSLPLYL